MRVTWIQALLTVIAVVSAAVSLHSQLGPQQTSGKTSTAHKNVRATQAEGAVQNGTYRNNLFGFQYKIPFGWVERTEQMREGSSEHVGAAAPGRPAEPSSASGRSAAPVSKSLLLLAVFERPPEATGDSVNSAVVITAESTEVYPGLKTAAAYFAPLTDVATGKGFQVVNEPYYFSVGARRLVRGDFNKKIGQVTMYQSSLVMMEKGHFVSFTFVGGNEDDVNELIDRLSFPSRTIRTPQTRK